MTIWDENKGAYIELDVVRGVHEAALRVEARADEWGWEPYNIAEWHVDHTRGTNRDNWRAVRDYLLTRHCCVTRATRINVIAGAPLRLRNRRLPPDTDSR